jgi:hypothetical protein
MRYNIVPRSKITVIDVLPSVIYHIAVPERAGECAVCARAEGAESMHAVETGSAVERVFEAGSAKPRRVVWKSFGAVLYSTPWSGPSVSVGDARVSVFKPSPEKRSMPQDDDTYARTKDSEYPVL